MKILDNGLGIDKFRALILARLGLNFDEDRLGYLAEVLQNRLDETRLPVGEYFRRLEFDGAVSELTSLATKLTVPETYFFRNFDQFRAFRDIAVPAAMAAHSDTRKLRFLSAGCASGEEPYSIAMTLMSMNLDPSWTWSVRAIDINATVLKKAKRGHYSQWALRETSPEDQRRWFRADNRDYILDEAVRRAVEFRECNLADENYDIWEPQSYDVVFCRNVLMYFSTEQARKVLARISKALRPGGFLFLGHAETLRGWSEDFHLRHTHQAFYYERKRADELAGTDDPAYSSFNAAPVAAPSISDDWIQSIHRASERVQALSSEPPAIAPSPVTRPPKVAPDMAPVFAMLRADRFTEALAYVHEMPKDAGNDPDVLLVEAMLLAHGGKTEDAESVCERLLQMDELNASAHHVLALCRETAADIEGAMEHDRIAAYLDPTFAMPHLHMGLMGRRTGNRDLGRRELAHALTLLKHEDSARLMLFAGGFNRQSMIELCESALKDCGGKL